MLFQSFWVPTSSSARACTATVPGLDRAVRGVWFKLGELAELSKESLSSRTYGFTVVHHTKLKLASVGFEHV